MHSNKRRLKKEDDDVIQKEAQRIHKKTVKKIPVLIAKNLTEENPSVDSRKFRELRALGGYFHGGKKKNRNDISELPRFRNL